MAFPAPSPRFPAVRYTAAAPVPPRYLAQVPQVPPSAPTSPPAAPVAATTPGFSLTPVEEAAGIGAGVGLVAAFFLFHPRPSVSEAGFLTLLGAAGGALYAKATATASTSA